MVEYEKKWQDCLSMIRERVISRENGEREYNVWYADVTLESYDGKGVVLRVPSRYVYEYLEMYCTRLLSEVLSLHFGPDTRLNYRVASEPTFAQAAGSLHSETPGPAHILVPNARKRMEDGLKYYLKDKARWLPAYDKVAEWLSDNKGRGLLCVGTTGLGKTLICRDIIPVILGSMGVFTAQEMNNRIDEVLKEKVIVIDDLGKEAVETRTYGNRRTPFFELCDAAEREGKILVITTNLSTTPVKDPRYPSSIQQRYGEAVIDRLRSITKVVVFEGESMRGY